MKRLALIITALAVLASGAAVAQDPARLLKTAMDLELVDHDPKAAIEQYKKVVAAGDRVLAAQALLRMAGCYQKLGDAEATKTYERIVRDFGNQPEAAEAKRQLPAFGTSAPSRVLVWTKPSGVSIVTVSPNGRYVLCQPGVDSDGLSMSFSVAIAPGVTGLSVHDLTTGADRALTQPTQEGNLGFTGGRAAWSRDSQLIAYTSAISEPGGPRRQLRVAEVRADGSGSNRVVLDNLDIKDVSAYDWTQDRRLIAVILNRVDGARQIALVSAADGSLRVLKTLGWRGANALTLSPDGRFLAFGLPASDSSRNRVSVLATDGSREVAVMRTPDDDVPLGWSPDGKALFFVRKRGESDQLWTVAFSENGAPAEPKFIRDPGLLDERATLTTSGALYVYDQPRQSSTLLSASVDLATGTLTSALTDAGRLLGASASDDLTSPLSFSPDGRSVAYRHRVRRSSEVITVRDIATGSARDFQPDLQLGYRTMVWSPDSRFLTIGGSELDGRRHGLFRLEVETGTVTPIVLTTSADELNTEYVAQPWSTDGARFYYLRIFQGGGKGRVLVEHDVVSGEERELMPRGMWAVALATDQRTVYYYDVSKSANVLIARDLASGTEREVAKGVNGIALSPDGRFLATSVRTPGSQGRSALVIGLSASPPPDRVLQEFTSVLAWAPDSQAVIARKSVGVAGQADSAFRQEFWCVPLDGRTPRLLLESHAVADERLSFVALHPNGRRVVVQKTSLRPLPSVEVWRFENYLGTAGRAR